jgi:DNA polymerase alpha subunit B
VANVRSISQSYFRTFGRINTKKDTNTVILEGCVRRKDLPAAETIELDFRNMKQYSVFSGQIVAVEVTNPLGNRLYIREIFAKAYAPLASPPKIRSRINVFVAAGPFTASNNMQYQPLWNLMEKVATEQPHILILIGPFLEYTHPAIENVKETYQEIFEKIVSKIMEMTK